MAEGPTDLGKYKFRGTIGESFDVERLRKAVDGEMVEITEEAIFAGKKVFLKKKVSSNSEEAKKWFKKQSKGTVTSTGASSLDTYLSQVRKTKTVNSMDKSSVDWNKYKTERNLDLEEERQKGFLDKVGFLNEVAGKSQEQIREAKRRKMDQ